VVPRTDSERGLKVLVTGFDWHGDIVPFVARALARLGVSSEVVWTNRDTLIRARAARLNATERLPVVGRSVAGRWRSRLALSAARAVNDRFAHEVDRARPDVVLSLLCWGDPLTADSVRQAPVRKRIAWLMDDPFGYEYSGLEDLVAAYDDVYSVDDGWSDNVELMTGRRPRWLPCGADPESQHPVDPSAFDPELRGHIVYVGSSCHGHPAAALRRSLVESLDGLPVALFGDPAWRLFGGFAASCYRGGPVSTERANVIYASAAVALNFHHPQFRRGTSLRTFALCASGVFQLADWREGLDRWLTPGEDLDVFRSPQELRAKAERYLGDPLARRRIAEAGRARVLAEHTYAHRLTTMLSSAGLLNAGRGAGSS
jgi:spore maturation protein CgeB